ncbi:BACON domain-containing protein [Petrimonas sp.]|uniref:BACON domain-containing protein n=1 Tax=Petrimonas sp. TaxID=2023866 RepID=UPI003F51A1CD
MRILFCIFIFFSVMAFNVVAKQTENKIPIIAWHGIPAEKSSELFPLMKEAGIPIYLGKYNDITTTLKILDIAQKAGVKLITSCPELKSDVEATVKRLMKHPALYGYYLKDEPETGDLPDLGVWVKQVQSFDKEHPCYINLYPNWAWGKEQYATHVASFIEQVPVPFISFDHYPVALIDSIPILRPEWYRNLEEISVAAQKAKLPFWAFALTSSHYLGPPSPPAFYPVPTLPELRLQVFSNLAYGAQALQYFTFAGAVDKNGKTPVYDLLQTVNREIQNLSGIFLDATVVSVWHTGAHIPEGTQRLEKMPVPQVKALSTTGTGAVVSLLKKGDSQYLVIVNRDYKKTMVLAVNLDKSVKKILKNGTTIPANKSTERIEAGDMLIYTWKILPKNTNNQ